jgi:hypothetical protein
MSRLLLRLSLCFIVVIFALALTARALGGTQPPNLALRGFIEGCEGKSQPCWYGLVPGETSYAEVVARLHELGMMISDRELESLGFYYFYFEDMERQSGEFEVSYNTVSRLTIRLPDKLKLLEAMTIWGAPTFIDHDPFGDVLLQFASHTNTRSRSPEFDNRLRWQWLSLSSYIYYIQLNPPPGIPMQGFVWHGFAPRWRYCQDLQTSDATLWLYYCL